MLRVGVALFLWVFTGYCMAAVKAQTVDYIANGVMMQGFVAFDDAKTSPQPGILIVPDWMGVGEFFNNRAQDLAQEGYAAFVVDIYGKDNRPKNTEEAGKLVTKYKNDRDLVRSRMKAAFDKFTSMKEVDPQKVMVMGYCFGGMAALELARSGIPIVGTATFHGSLSSPTPEDAKNIKGPVLVMHGADDPFVPPKEVEAFKTEMKNAGVDLNFVAYPGAVHAFTNPDIGNDKSKGVAYNKEADEGSWAEFHKFLKKIF